MRRNQLVTQAFAVHKEQSTTAPPKGEDHTERVQKLLDEMHSEFGRRRKILISGLPPDFTEEVGNAISSALFKHYYCVHPHKDGMILSCHCLYVYIITSERCR